MGLDQSSLLLAALMGHQSQCVYARYPRDETRLPMGAETRISARELRHRSFQ